MPPNIRDDGGGEDYNWDYFTLASKEEKARYIDAQIVAALRRLVPSSYGEPIPQSVLEAADELGVPRSMFDVSIDHQSIISIPLDSADPTKLSKPYIDALRRAALKDHVIIAGGNDNDGVDHPLTAYLNYIGPFQTQTIDLQDLASSCRDDGTHLVMFNKWNGDKFRIIEDSVTGTPKRAKYPELVDVKITDYCQYGCTYCYQGSTKDGKHASLADFKKIIDILAEMGVFEVAIGGGEPTEHPDFMEMLHYTHSKGIRPNFTTRNLSYVQKHQSEMDGVVGAIAASVDTVAAASLWRKFMSSNGSHRIKYNLQVVIGSVDTATLRSIANGSRFSDDITLLGWKSINRGAVDKQLVCDWQAVWDEISDYREHIVQLRCDTAFIDQFRNEILENSPNVLTIGAPEGTFSCYIDAVAGTMAASSYAGVPVNIDINSKDQVVSVWNRIADESAK